MRARLTGKRSTASPRSVHCSSIVTGCSRSRGQRGSLTFLSCVPPQLSVYRNLALSPVNGTAPNGRSFEEVVFVNDVFACPRDALELLHQRKLQNAHATCAVDWRATRPAFRKLGFNSVKMYDNWVSFNHRLA